MVMQNRYIYILCLILAFTDVVLINSAFFAAFNLVGPGREHLSLYRDFIIIFNLLWFICARAFDLYNKKTLHDKLLHTSTLECISLHYVILLLYVIFIEATNVSLILLLVFFLLLSFILFAGRLAAMLAGSWIRRRFKVARPVVLLGINPTSIQLADYFKNHDRQYSFEEYLNTDKSATDDFKENILPAISRQMKKAAETGVNEVYISLGPHEISNAGLLLKEADKQCVRLRFVPDFSKSLERQFSINYLGGLPVISLNTEPLEEMHNRFLKRLFDITFSLGVLVLIFSWLYPLLAVLIKLQGPGPVFFKQLRSGRNNESFWCYKFRSMKVNGDSDSRQASKNDSRVTPIGRFLRKSSLDELPQFLNVLMGNMSIVGPRPHMLQHTEQYRNIIDKYMVRHYLKPGITGWAQINGYRGETGSIELMEKRVKHDLWYLENWTPLLDIKIVFLTVIHLIKDHDNAF
ncbi:undecaprenyl-phosphate glucose phosphotransferase [Arcticibacter tournemirensis]|uniref:Undecaprenyl-phosphate glucose phosphotransferase n=2 Tax=Arcticibacter tournemirensis TaxID=699437 RepID=A0A4Q0M9J6_9SPHI|nr:undecaprenyl-phosphate glucose phosphotransferase [Arcticibacter tournemirensis]